jgi:hypothetical protein
MLPKIGLVIFYHIKYCRGVKENVYLVLEPVSEPLKSATENWDSLFTNLSFKLCVRDRSEGTKFYFFYAFITYNMRKLLNSQY